MGVLRLGVIGAGFVANFHARALMQVRSIEIAGVTSRTTASAEQFSKTILTNHLGELFSTCRGSREWSWRGNRLSKYCRNG